MIDIDILSGYPNKFRIQIQIQTYMDKVQKVQVQKAQRVMPHGRPIFNNDILSY